MTEQGHLEKDCTNMVYGCGDALSSALSKASCVVFELTMCRSTCRESFPRFLLRHHKMISNITAPTTTIIGGFGSWYPIQQSSVGVLEQCYERVKWCHTIQANVCKLRHDTNMLSASWAHRDNPWQIQIQCKSSKASELQLPFDRITHRARYRRRRARHVRHFSVVPPSLEGGTFEEASADSAWGHCRVCWQLCR